MNGCRATNWIMSGSYSHVKERDAGSSSLLPVWLHYRQLEQEFLLVPHVQSPLDPNYSIESVDILVPIQHTSLLRGFWACEAAGNKKGSKKESTAEEKEMVVLHYGTKFVPHWVVRVLVKTWHPLVPIVPLWQWENQEFVSLISIVSNRVVGRIEE